MVLVVIGLLALGQWAPVEAQLTRGPYLQSGTETSIIVRWRTDEPRTSRVCVYTNLGRTWEDCRTDPNAWIKPVAETEHVIELTGLTPSTKYYYFVGTVGGTFLSGGAADADPYFKTSPPVGISAPTRVWVIGDSGTGFGRASNEWGAAERVRQAYVDYVNTNDTDATLMLGDNAYEITEDPTWSYYNCAADPELCADGADTTYQARVFDTYDRSVAGKLLRKTVLWPTLGNHDWDKRAEVYYRIFSLPTAAHPGGAFYSFDYGNIHFITLDSNRAPSSMRAWLIADLDSARAAGQEWIIVYWHHAPYSKGSHDSDNCPPPQNQLMCDMRNEIVPILQSYEVDLVLSGHSHSYERSLDLTTRPVFAVVGSSGQVTNPEQYPALCPDNPNDCPKHINPDMSRLLELGSLVLEINGGTLDAKFVTPQGVADTFTITKGGPPSGLVAIQDAYISEAEPDSNLGSVPTLRVDGDDPPGSGTDLRALLQWDVSSIPSGSSVTSATISVNIINPTGGTYHIYQMRPNPEDGDWDELTVTWNTRGVRGTAVLGEMACPDAGRCTFSLNPTGRAVVQGWVNGTVLNRGLVILNTDVTDGVSFDSRETANPPTLTIR